MIAKLLVCAALVVAVLALLSVKVFGLETGQEAGLAAALLAVAALI